MDKNAQIKSIEKQIAAVNRERDRLYKKFHTLSDKIWDIKYSMLDQKYYAYNELESIVYLKYLFKERVKGRGLVLYFEKVHAFSGDYGFIYYSRYGYEAYHLVNAMLEKKLVPIPKKDYDAQFKCCLDYITCHGNEPSRS